MSYGVMPYSVDLDVIRGILGSGNREALERLQTNFQSRAEAIGEHIDARLSDETVADKPTAYDVLRHMILGEPYDERIGFAYGYCLEYLCDTHGQLLYNDAWSAVRASFITAVQEQLARAGVPKATFSLESLVFGEPPIPLPPIEDFPSIGFLSKQAGVAALEALSSVQVATLEDAELRAPIAALQVWLTKCRDSGRDLVCFYY